jgi:hypothetical protein
MPLWGGLLSDARGTRLLIIARSFLWRIDDLFAASANTDKPTPVTFALASEFVHHSEVMSRIPSLALVCVALKN